jgi:hypothetical protein
LLDKSELLPDSTPFEYVDISGKSIVETLPEHSLGFTVCQVPIVVSAGAQNKVDVVFDNDQHLSFSALKLDPATSRELFSRTGKIKKILCEFSP